MDLVKALEDRYKKPEIPEMNIGNRKRYGQGKKQPRENPALTDNNRQDCGINETITVRRVSYNVGCEKVFPIHSPIISSIQVLRRGKVRRAKLYYLRDRVGKAAKTKEKI